LLKFEKDRKKWLQWLLEAKRRYGLVILNYAVTSNHYHLLVADDADREVIPSSIRLVAGRTGQEFNQRKRRKGAFWEDRYHATAIENGDHLLRCIVYIDLNMVRAGAVSHPVQWSYCGYKEIQQPKRKNVLICYDKLRRLLGFDTYERMQAAHKEWVETQLSKSNSSRDDKWTKSVAVGSAKFVENIKGLMGAAAIGRKNMESDGSFQLREHQISYGNVFEAEKSEIALENTCLWSENRMNTVS
jgi:putative transposase